MNIKQKFNSIDQSKLDSKQVEILKNIEQKTDGFKTKDKELISKIDTALDKIISALKDKNPEAIKTKTTSKTKSQKSSGGGKRTLFSIAKDIRKSDETWEEAKNRAKKIMEDENKQTTQKMKSETEKLLAFIKRKKELDGLSGTSVKKDSKIEALPKGRRVSKKGWKNQYGESEGGRVYYENRDNRTDRLAPNFSDKVYLAGGGYANKGVYVETLDEEIDLSDDAKVRARKTQQGSNKSYSELREKHGGSPEAMAFNNGGTIIGIPETQLGRNLGIDYTTLVGETGSMSAGEMFAYGGKSKSKPSMRELYIEQISSLIGARIVGVQKFVDDNNLTDSELSNLMTGLGRGIIKRSDFVTAMSGEKNNPMQKEIIDFAKSDKAYKMADGGNVIDAFQMRTVRGIDNNPTEVLTNEQKVQFANGGISAGEMFAMGGSLGNHGLKQGDQIIKTMSGGVQKVKTKSGDIVYVNLANGYRGAEPPLPFDKGGKLTRIKLGDAVRYKDEAWYLSQKKGVVGIVNMKQGAWGSDFPFIPLSKIDIERELKDFYGNPIKKGEIPYLVEDFAKGGGIPNNYQDRYYGDIWDIDWTQEQKNHFLQDHKNEIGFDEEFYGVSIKEKTTKKMKSSKGQEVGFTYIDIDKLLKTKSSELPKYVKLSLQKHIREGQYAYGGRTRERKYLNHSQKHEVRYSKDKPHRRGYGYEEGGFMTDPNFGDFQNQVYATGGAVGKKKTQEELRKEYLEKLGSKEADVWDKIGAKSGSQIRNSDKMLKAYAEGVEEMLQKEGVGKGSFDQEDYDFYTDENWHLFNEFLVWNGYYEPEMTKTEKAWREDRFKDPKYRNYVSNPSVIKVSGSSKSKSKSSKYIVKADIKEVKVKTDAGYEYTFKGSDVLNGVNILEKGSLLKNNATYVAKRNIMYVELKNGERIKPANGYWIKKDAKGELFKPEKKEEYKVMSNQAIFPKRGAGTYWYVENSKGQTINNTTGKPYKGKEMTNYYFLNEEEAKKFAKKLNNSSFEGGGKTTFKEKATAIAKKFEGKKVEPKYQKEYGKTYDKAEAKEVGNKIAGSQKAKYDSKMSGGGSVVNLDNKYVYITYEGQPLEGGETQRIVSHKYSDSKFDKKTLTLNFKDGSNLVLEKEISDFEKGKEVVVKSGEQYVAIQLLKDKAKTTKTSKGGSTKRGGAMQLAKEIRKEGESWASALKRANKQIRNQK